MNYTQIEQDYPKAYGVFKQSKYYRVSDSGYLLFDDRDLYDFFDERELFIEISHTKREWSWIIFKGDDGLECFEYSTKRRTSAEACAFNAAFKLLEETL